MLVALLLPQFNSGGSGGGGGGRHMRPEAASPSLGGGHSLGGGGASGSHGMMGGGGGGGLHGGGSTGRQRGVCHFLPDASANSNITLLQSLVLRHRLTRALTILSWDCRWT
jgi:hypothetical protein